MSQGNDTNGRVVEAGANYYVMAAAGKDGTGGCVLGVQKGANYTCSLEFVELMNEIATVIPITFSLVNPDYKFVHKSTNLNIKFPPGTICASSPVWEVRHQ